MLSYISPEDEIWGIPVVLYFVWTVVLMVSTMIVLSCLGRETKKFNKKLGKADNKDELVSDIKVLERLMARYVQLFLGQGILDTMSQSLTPDSEPSEADKLRSEIKAWFTVRCKELESMNYTEKSIKRIILAAIRTGLTKHPLDLRGSRRSLEAAKIFLEVDTKTERLNFLDTSILFKNNPDGKEESKDCVCPTYPCQRITSTFLKVANLLFSHPNAIPALCVFISFVVWLYDIITDAVIIQILWDFKLPNLYHPINETLLESDVTFLSYQTLTIDLYAPLLLLILLFSLLYTLMSCSCSRLSERYKISSRYNKSNCELADEEQEPTTTLARYEFQIIGAITSSLSQFCLQFSSYMLILYMLETLALLAVDKGTKDTVTERINDFQFKSLWNSGIASGLSLCIAQYSAFKIQREHDLTITQRMIYFIACIFNTMAMMTTCVMFITVILIPVVEYIGRYHIMILIILVAAVIGTGVLVSCILALFGLDQTSISIDKVVSKVKDDNNLTSLLRFNQMGKGRWAVILGSVTIIGKLFSLVTINLFLPPSQLLIHPFYKFYTNSPRSPALHYVIAKQLMCYNILMVITAILLAVDIQIYNFNYTLSHATQNLLIAANITGVPCVFLSLLVLFKFYSSYDIWTSNGVHLVFQPNDKSSDDDIEAGNLSDNETRFDQTNITEIQDNTLVADNDETLDGSPNAESTLLANGDTVSNPEEESEQTEADRSLQKKKKRIQIIKTKAASKLNKKMKNSCSFVTDASDVLVGGRWINVSD